MSDQLKLNNDPGRALTQITSMTEASTLEVRYVERTSRDSTVTSAVARKLESIRIKGAMQNVEVANLLGQRPETVLRWNTGRAYPQASTEKVLLELEYIVDQLADLYDPNEVRQWIFAPQKLLAGISPAELVRNCRIDEVMQLVGQLRDAVHL